MGESKVYSFIGLAKKAGMVAAGEGQVEAAIKKKKAALVIIAKDASINTRKKIEVALYESGISLIEFGHKEKLGHMLGRALFSVIAITDCGFAGRINELIYNIKNKENTAYGGGLFE